MDDKFFYAITNRKELFKLLPKDTIGCEIGVQRGHFSAIILENANPNQLHLIDPWRFSEIAEYSADGANVQQVEQDKIHRGVVKRFKSEISTQKVILHRKTSAEALSDFEDGSLDFVYVDGMHHYEAVLNDLVGYAAKLKPGGLLLGHDYSENYHSHRMGFGVVGAVTSFLNRTNYKIILLTHETWSTYVLANDTTTGAAQYLIERLMQSNIEFVALPQLLSASLKHISFKREIGNLRWIPCF